MKTNTLKTTTAPLRRALAVATGLLLLATASACGPVSVRVAGVVRTSFDVEQKFWRGVGDTTTRRPESDEGVLRAAEVRLTIPSKGAGRQPERKFGRTSEQGEFELYWEMPLFGKPDTLIVVFQSDGYLPEQFEIKVSDILRAEETAAGKRYFMEFWLPLLTER